MDFFGFVPLGVATATQQFAEPRIVLFSVVLAAVVAAAVWGVVLRPQPAAELFFRWIGGPNNGQRDLLNKYDGVRETRIFMGVQGRVFDVSTGSDFYGPGGGYSVLAGRDASRALGVMSLQGKAKWEEDCRIRHIDDLTPKQLKVLEDWDKKFVEKYPIVGELLADEGTAASAGTTEAAPGCGEAERREQSGGGSGGAQKAQAKQAENSKQG